MADQDADSPNEWDRAGQAPAHNARLAGSSDGGR